jgi:hypothetical protein
MFGTTKCWQLGVTCGQLGLLEVHASAATHTCCTYLLIPYHTLDPLSVTLTTHLCYTPTGSWPNNGYNQGADPWQRTAFRDYRRQLYDIMSRWGAQGGGPIYRVDGIYLWNVGTWDIHGVHPSAYNSQGSFGDSVIRQTIKAGNARAYRKKL